MSMILSTRVTANVKERKQLPVIAHRRRVFRMGDYFTRGIVIGVALYLVCELAYAFSSGAVERLVR